jgi:hypothetical protein
MSRVSPARFARARARQEALTDSEWLLRCDELAQQQHVLLMELLTFGRDGASASQVRSLIDYLSSLQFLAADEAGPASAPVGLPELRRAVERAVCFFHAATTDDRPHFDRIIRAWNEGVALRSEPVVWAGCIETLKQHEILSSPLAREMVVTLYAIADVYSRRLGDRAASSVVEN